MSISNETLLKLQNGSDVRGIAVEGIPGEHINLTGEAANQIAQAFAQWLSRKLEKSVETLRIGVGYDSRISAPSLKTHVLLGITAAGGTAFDCGLASTPSMFMSLIYPETAFDGALMITASHLPYNRNGFKFFDGDGGLESSDITRILKLAAKFEPAVADITEIPQVDLISLYTAALRAKIKSGVKAENYEHPLTGLRIAVDAGNGAGGFFVKDVLCPLGADVSGSQFLEPDGMFPNHIPNPENVQAMDSIRHATIASRADLGIIFDTDVDRMSAVLSNGTEVNRDAIIALMAAILAPDNPASAIVTDSVTSDKLTDFLENVLHLRHHRFKRGYKNVINEQKRLNSVGVPCPLAIETSGHGALSENYFLDDGAYMAVKILIAAAKAKRVGKQIDTLIEKFVRPFESREYRLKLLCENGKSYGSAVLKTFEERAREEGYAVAPNSHEGVRLSFTGKQVQGWALLRLSLHDPLMPLNLEGNRAGDCDKIGAIVKNLLRDFEDLDLTSL